MPTYNPSDEFHVVRDGWLESLYSGEEGDCPCCKRYAKVYKRSIHKNLVAFLAALSTTDLRDADGWVDVPALLRKFRSARDFCLLKHWGLIEDKANTDSKKRTSGLYRITSHGRDFLRGQIRVPKHIHVFDDRIVAVSSSSVSVHDCYGDSFDYSNLMGQ